MTHKHSTKLLVNLVATGSQLDQVCHMEFEPLRLYSLLISHMILNTYTATYVTC